MARVFISFDYQDIASKKVVDNWTNQNLGSDISFSSVDGHDILQNGELHLKKALREIINKAQIILVLVGDNTHNRPWVDHEVHHGKSHEIKVIWTQLPNTKGAPPKEISKSKAIPFNMNLIQDVIRGKLN
jgi:CO dehydrogenase/acetyl-CoA synthase epsilon subunit